MDRPVKIAPVRKSVEVACDVGRAFDFFVERIDDWWPKDRYARAIHEHEGEHPAEIVMEPRAGGRVFERRSNGEELDWGRVTAFEPGVRLVFTWHLSRPAGEATEVEVRFEVLDPSRTRVFLEHRGWERWGEIAAASRETYDSVWDDAFAGRYADYVSRSA